MQTLRENNFRIFRIKNAKFSGYYFYMNYNKYEDFQIYICAPLIKHKLINLDRIANNLIVHNLLINYLNLIKDCYVVFSPVFCSCFKISEAAVSRCSSNRCSFLQYSEESLFLIKLQVCNFSVNIQNF